MNEPVTFGIDTNSYGFHLAASHPIRLEFEHGNVPSKFAWHQAGKGLDVDARRQSALNAACLLFKQIPDGSAVFVEEPIVITTNHATTRSLCMMAGVLQAAFFVANPDASWFWVPLWEWRQEVLGRGSGRKVEMKRAALRKSQSTWDRLEAEANQTLFEEQPDLADATCIMLHGVQQLSSGRARSS